MTTTERTPMRVALERAAQRADDEVAPDVLDQLIAAAEAQAGAAPGTDQVADLARRLEESSHREIDAANHLERAADEVQRLRAESAQLADRLERALRLLRGMARKVSAFRRYSVLTERQLTQAHSDAETWEAEYERVRDERLDDLTPEHVHAYPWPERFEPPEPCECGKVHPWFAAEEGDEVVPELTSWEQLMSDLRDELATWPEGGGQ